MPTQTQNKITNFTQLHPQTTTTKNEAQKLPQYIAAIITTIGGFIFGTALAWTSPTQEQLQNGEYGFDVSDTDMGWIGSLVNLGAALMCFPAGTFMDLMGRKVFMLLLIVPGLLGWGLMVGASNVGMMIAGRVFTGMAGGAFAVAAPLYTSEISEKDIRGRLGSYFQLLLSCGVLFTYLVGAFVSAFVLAIVCTCVPVVFGLTFFWMPESPVYYVMKNKTEQARKSLQWLRGKDYDIEPEIKEIQVAIEEKKENSKNFREIMGRTATKKAFFACYGLMFFQQFGGINAVIFYTSSIFADAGSTLQPEIASIIVGAMQVVATFVATLVVEKLGRKMLLLISDLVMFICALLLFVYFYLQNNVMDADEIQDISWLPVMAVCIFIIAFSFGYGPIPWMYVSEVFPSEVKSVASSTAATFNWTLSFLVTRFFGDLNTAIGTEWTFFIFACVSFIGTIFVIFFVLETKGKSLAEIQAELGSPPAFLQDGIVNKEYDHTL